MLSANCHAYIIKYGPTLTLPLLLEYKKNLSNQSSFLTEYGAVKKSIGSTARLKNQADIVRNLTRTHSLTNLYALLQCYINLQTFVLKKGHRLTWLQYEIMEEALNICFVIYGSLTVCPKRLVDFYKGSRYVRIHKTSVAHSTSFNCLLTMRLPFHWSVIIQ